jgi:hypothetical protein
MGNFYGRQEPNNEQFRHKAINAIFFNLIVLYLYTLFRTEEMLEEYRLQGGSSGLVVNMQETDTDESNIRKSTIYFGSDRFILFKELKFGQGKATVLLILQSRFVYCRRLFFQKDVSLTSISMFDFLKTRNW